MAIPARGLIGRLLASAGQKQTKLVVGMIPVRQAKLMESFKTSQPDVFLDSADELDCLLQDKSRGDRLGGGADSDHSGGKTSTSISYILTLSNAAPLFWGKRGCVNTGGKMAIHSRIFLANTALPYDHLPLPPISSCRDIEQVVVQYA